MAMPGRTYASTIGGYRYAHNGQEKDGEIFDGALSAEFWEYDSRLGRRWEVDPVNKEWLSPYSCFDNNPILFADPDGDDIDWGGGVKGFFKMVITNIKSIFHKKLRDQLKLARKPGTRWTFSKVDGAPSLNDGGKVVDCHPNHKIIEYSKRPGKNHPEPPRDEFTRRSKYKIRMPHINLPHFNMPHFGRITFKHPFHGWGFTFSIGKGQFGTPLSFGIGNWQNYNMFGLARTRKYTMGQIARNCDPAFSNPVIKIKWHTKKNNHMNFFRFGISLRGEPLIDLNIKRHSKKK